MPDQRPPRANAPVVAVAGTLAATVLMLVLATWAASIGPDRVVGSEGREAGASLTRNTDPNTASGRRAVPNPQPRVSREVEHPTWVKVLGRVLTVLMLLVVGYLLYRMLAALARMYLGRRRSRRESDAPALDFEVLEAPSRAAAEAVLGDGEEQRDLLGTGTPRNAIVACWHRFEVQAATVGLARRGHETSSEFTLRLLDLVSADQHSVSRLAALYREARFSDHELDESDRERARAALDGIHRELAARWSGAPR